MLTADTMEKLQAYRMYADNLPSVTDTAAEYEEEEETLRAQLLEYVAADLWAQDHEGPSLLARIRDITGGRMLRPSASDVATDWRESIPAHYRRMQGGIRADRVCSELGFESESDLMAAIQAEAGTRFHSHAEAESVAESIVKTLPDMVAMQEQHAASLQTLQEEWARIRATLADLTAQLQAEIAEDFAPVATMAGESSPIPSRRARYSRVPATTAAIHWFQGIAANAWSASQLWILLVLAAWWDIAADCGQHPKNRAARAHCAYCRYHRADRAARQLATLAAPYVRALSRMEPPEAWTYRRAA